MNSRIIISVLVTLSVLLCYNPTTAIAAAGAKDFTRPTKDEIRKEVSGINVAIRQRGGKWTAGETSMTRLSKAERMKRLGISRRPLPGNLRTTAPTLTATGPKGEPMALTAPTAPNMDWRDNSGDFVTGVRDQGSCGSCWAFGSTAALESKILLENGTPGIDLDLSEQVIVSCDSADWSYASGGCGGGNLVTSYFVNTGIPEETCYPYDETNSGTCEDACTDWQLTAYKTTGYTWVVPYGAQQTVEQLKTGLYVYGPLVVTYAIYSDFYSYSSGIYSHTTGEPDGYHAVMLAGYDDTEGCFIVKNSWGSGWGEGGYFRIAYSEVENVCDFGYEALAYGDPVDHDVISFIGSPIDGQAIHGPSYNITGKAWPANGFNLTRVDVSTDGGAKWHKATGTDSWSYDWSQLPPDGTYSVISMAADDGGNVESPVFQISVTVDTVAPASQIEFPADGAGFTDTVCTVSGTASDPAGSGIKQVDVGITPEGGQTTWYRAAGTDNWSFGWPTPAQSGVYTLQPRARDMADNFELSGPFVSVTSVSTMPLCSWGSNGHGELGNGTNTNWPVPTVVTGLGGVTKVAAGDLHTAALRYDGTVWTSGDNEYGALGDGTTNNSNVPVRVAGLDNVTAIACGHFHTLATKSDGTVWTWGFNSGGQLGTGSKDWNPHPLPVQVIGLNNVVAVAGGKWHSAALKSDGTVWTWGYNINGQLGDGTTVDKYTPVQVSGLADVVAISCGEANTAALKSDGTLWTWGYNSDGELGDGTAEERHLPVQVAGLSGVVAVSCGYAHTVALKSDGTVWAWGYNGCGEIGDGTVNNNRYSPRQALNITGVSAVSGGGWHTVALKSDGTVWTWGWNEYGELGIGEGYNGDFRSLPVQATGLDGSNVVSVSGGGWSTAAIMTTSNVSSGITAPADGMSIADEVYDITGTAWADAGSSGVQKVEVGITPAGGQTTWHLATGTTDWHYSWTLPPEGSFSIQSRATSNEGAVEIPVQGITVSVDNTPPSSWIAVPSQGEILQGNAFLITGGATPGASTGVDSVEVGITPSGGQTEWSLATGTTGWQYTWDQPEDGTFTIQTRATSSKGIVETPGPGVTVTVDNTPPYSTVTAPASGAVLHGRKFIVTGDATDATGVSSVEVGITPQGGTTSWHTATGGSTWGYVWDLPGNGEYTVTSRAIDGAGNVETPATGITITVANTQDVVSAWAWGYNGYGQLGDGRQALQDATPIHMQGPAEVTAVDCGDYHTSALTPEGAVWSCGYNVEGELGDGTTSFRYTPVTASGLGGIADIECGSYHTLALGQDGRLYAWGRNSYGQLGDGSTTDRHTFVQLSGIGGISAVAGGGFHSVALTADGNVYTWGLNSSGQLGDGGNADSSTPVQVPGLDGIVSIAAGLYHTVALKSDGTVWAWGRNSNGQIGDGTTTRRDSPVQAAGLDGVVAVACGAYHTIAIRCDGTVWTWGANGNGQLGDGTTTQRELPYQVPGISGVVEVAGGEGHTVALRSGGTVASWGNNSDGQLGDGTTTESHVPVDVAGLDGVVAVAAGDRHTAALQVPPDTTSPGSSVMSPADGENLYGRHYTVTGTASDEPTGSGVRYVEISTDGGATWQYATGTYTWSYEWDFPPGFGDVTVMSRATDYSGNVQGPPTSFSVTLARYGEPELQHYNWDAWLTGGDCTVCHVTATTFLGPDFMDDPSFCVSCHNPASAAHDRTVEPGRGHVIMVNVTSGTAVMPVYGNISTGEHDDRPYAHLMGGDRVVCVTCHNPMRKTGDFGRVWEYTYTDDGLAYALANGGWDGFGWTRPEVYADTTLWGAGGPSCSIGKKAYLVDPSGYTFNERSGIVRFSGLPDQSRFVYVTLDYPYLRATSEDNTLCADCHPEKTHRDLNCLVCHTAHDTDNIAAMRGTIRTPDLSEWPVVFRNYTGRNSFADGNGTFDGVCEVCHTKTIYYGRDGSAFAAHTSTGQNYDGMDCTACHGHDGGFGAQ